MTTLSKTVLEQKMARRNDSKDFLGWIKNSDHDQCKWAADYLAVRQFSSQLPLSIKAGDTYLSIESDAVYARYFEDIERQLSDRARVSADSKEAISSLIKKMRAAWNAKKNRGKSRRRKAYSYVMGRDIEKKLHVLAGENPINKTLEDIINREYNLYDDKQVSLKSNYKKVLDKCESLQKKLNLFDVEIKAEQETNKIIIEAIKSLYFKVAVQEIMMRKAENIFDELTDKEKAEAIKAQEEKMNFFDQYLKAEIASIGRRRTQ